MGVKFNNHGLSINVTHCEVPDDRRDPVGQLRDTGHDLDLFFLPDPFPDQDRDEAGRNEAERDDEQEGDAVVGHLLHTGRSQTPQIIVSMERFGKEKLLLR